MLVMRYVCLFLFVYRKRDMCADHELYDESEEEEGCIKHIKVSTIRHLELITGIPLNPALLIYHI